MTIDWAAFTPWSASAGGILIGLSAAIFILFNGRIAGISGIIGGLIPPQREDTSWRIAFLAGLIGAPLLYRTITQLPTTHILADTPSLIVAGLLVGLGTRYGAGCTSGHGVCGLSRMSTRSLVATATFMLAGFVTVALARHGLQLLG